MTARAKVLLVLRLPSVRSADDAVVERLVCQSLGAKV